MSTRALVLVVVGLLAFAPAPAHAGLGALAKLAKLGKVGSQAGKAAKAAKFAKAGAAAAKVGKAGALGVTGAVAAERAGLAFASLGDDAARSTAFLARSAEGELLWATKAAGTETVSAGKVGEAVRGLGASGKPALMLDRSAAELAPQIARENPTAELMLLEGEKRLPLRQKPGGEVGDLVVDVAGEAVDLGDYLGAGVEDAGDESDSWPFIGGAAVLLAFIIWLAVRKKSAPQPA